MQEIVVSLCALLLSTAITALKSKELWAKALEGREDKIVKYITIGVRGAYKSYVRGVKAGGKKMHPAEAQKARDIALSTAHKEATKRGDGKLLDGLSQAELDANLEGVLQAIKSEAALGDAARVSARPKSALDIRANIILFALALSATLGLAGCAKLDVGLNLRSGQDGQPVATVVLPENYEQIAAEAWEVWDRQGPRGELAEFDASAVGEDEARDHAYRSAQALMLYATAKIRDRRPVPSIPATISEATQCVIWYLAEVHPNLGMTWRDLYEFKQKEAPVSEQLRPLFEYQNW